MIPYQEHYSLIGTTDVPVEDYERSGDHRRRDRLPAGARQRVSRAAARARPTWSGPTAACGRCYDDGSADPSAVTRDYVFKVDALEGEAGPDRAPLLSIFGGKITTYRKLAEAALAHVAPYLPRHEAWRLDARRTAAGRRLAGRDRIAIFRRAVRRYPHLACRLPARASRAATARARSTSSATRATVADSAQDFGAGPDRARDRLLVRGGVGAQRRRRAVATHQVRPADDAGAARRREALLRQRMRGDASA